MLQLKIRELVNLQGVQQCGSNRAQVELKQSSSRTQVDFRQSSNRAQVELKQNSNRELQYRGATSAAFAQCWCSSGTCNAFELLGIGATVFTKIIVASSTIVASSAGGALLHCSCSSSAHAVQLLLLRQPLRCRRRSCSGSYNRQLKVVAIRKDIFKQLAYKMSQLLSDQQQLIIRYSISLYLLY